MSFLRTLPLMAAFGLAACAGTGGGDVAGGYAGAQARTLPQGTSASEIRRHCTEEARRQAETIPAIQSGQTSYTGGRDHDFQGCMKRHGL